MKCRREEKRRAGRDSRFCQRRYW